MAERDDFMEGLRGSGWNKYSPGYRSGEMLKKAMTYNPPAPKAAPVYIPPAPSLDLGPMMPAPSARVTPRSVDNCNYSSGLVGGSYNTAFEADWWLGGPIGTIAHAGESLKENGFSRFLGAALLGGATALESYGSHASASFVVLTLLATAFGAVIPVVVGWLIQNVFTVAGHLMAYASIALCATLVLGCLVGAGFLALRAFGHKPGPAVKAATVAQPLSTPTRNVSRKHRKTKADPFASLPSLSSKQTLNWDSVASVAPRKSSGN
jgi:hypothetical protein